MSYNFFVNGISLPATSYYIETAPLTYISLYFNSSVL